MDNKNNIIPMENFDIQKMIYTIRGKQVMIDSDIASLYQVSTSQMNQQVSRNIKRFPEQFMFQLTENEYEDLRSQFVISNWNENGGISTLQNLRSQIVTSRLDKTDEKRGGRRYMPYAFTEQGIAMLSSKIK